VVCTFYISYRVSYGRRRRTAARGLLAWAGLLAPTPRRPPRPCAGSFSPPQQLPAPAHSCSRAAAYESKCTRVRLRSAQQTNAHILACSGIGLAASCVAVAQAAFAAARRAQSCSLHRQQQQRSSSARVVYVCSISAPIGCRSQISACWRRWQRSIVKQPTPARHYPTCTLLDRSN
jgi:hypothetical protein